MNPKLPINGYALMDSEQRSKEHPETWGHPDHEVLARIEPGFLVKVGVTHQEMSGERFWGRVQRRSGPAITIKISQDLVCSNEHGLKDEDILVVGEQHIFGIIDADGGSVWEA